jgi:hypothetical protein
VPEALEEDPRARARLFGSPSGGKDEAMDADWKEHVEPTLHAHFQSAMEVLTADVATLKPSPRRQDLRVPLDHVEPWLLALNQARLALGARWDVNDDDMEDLPDDVGERALALIQIQFYGYIQECLLRLVE